MLQKTVGDITYTYVRCQWTKPPRGSKMVWVQNLGMYSEHFKSLLYKAEPPRCFSCKDEVLDLGEDVKEVGAVCAVCEINEAV